MTMTAGCHREHQGDADGDRRQQPSVSRPCRQLTGTLMVTTRSLFTAGHGLPWTVWGADGCLVGDTRNGARVARFPNRPLACRGVIAISAICRAGMLPWSRRCRCGSVPEPGLVSGIGKLLGSRKGCRPAEAQGQDRSHMVRLSGDAVDRSCFAQAADSRW